ncbi:hypothetical protein ABZ895_34560, partial [Streptomyces californicus]|uniref:hypothetical protein n=1 Tax=Streptomyces californicus TaxID=67351 RepID=UPI0033E1FA6C
VLPERDQLLDLVGYLNGDLREWTRRLASAVAAEEKWNRNIGAQSDATAELEALRVELEGFRVIANDPESVFAQSARVREDAQKRINFAHELESHLMATVSLVGNQLGEAQNVVPLAQAEAQAILDRARATAREMEYSARADAQGKLEEAEKEAKWVVSRAEAEASAIIDKAGAESRRIRADAGRIVDQLLLEGDQYLEEARVDRLQGELERQRGEALVERMKLRAKIDLAQVIMQAQQALVDSGAKEHSDLLDILLQDLGINDIPSNPKGLKGRHRRVASRPSSESISLHAAPLAESSESGSVSVVGEGNEKAPLPRRHKPQGTRK